MMSEQWMQHHAKMAKLGSECNNIFNFVKFWEKI